MGGRYAFDVGSKLPEFEFDLLVSPIEVLDSVDF